MPERDASVMRRIDEELLLLERTSRLRSLESTRGIDLCSNDYLGLASDPRLKQAAIEAVRGSSRIAGTGSRLLSGNAPEWEELEREFAEFIGTETALYFGSGYSANAGLLGAILKPGDTVFSDALNHASIIDGIRLSGAAKVIYPHCDTQLLERELRERRSAPGAKVIVTESLVGMDGDVAPLKEIFALSRGYGAELVIDEAHALGLYGPEGRGFAAEMGIQKEVLAVVCACGKALSCAGAVVCSSAKVKQYLVNRARTFIFSTAMPPYFAGQIRAALRLAREARASREHLFAMASAIHEELRAAGCNTGLGRSHIIPILLGGNEAALEVAAFLEKRGFAVRAIRPPTVPEGTARVRISLTSKITTEELNRLTRAIKEACLPFSQSSPASAVHA